MVAPSTSRRWLGLVLLCAVQFMVVLDISIVNIALPSLQQDLGFAQQHLQWVISGYGLTFGGFLMLAGRAADLFGRRRFFMLGLSLFAVASLAGGLASSQALLIGARALQGLGAAMVHQPRLRSSPQRSARGRSATWRWGSGAPLRRAVRLRGSCWGAC
jgi:MFS family permease